MPDLNISSISFTDFLFQQLFSPVAKPDIESINLLDHLTQIQEEGDFNDEQNVTHFTQESYESSSINHIEDKSKQSLRTLTSDSLPSSQPPGSLLLDVDGHAYLCARNTDYRIKCRIPEDTRIFRRPLYSARDGTHQKLCLSSKLLEDLHQSLSEPIMESEGYIKIIHPRSSGAQANRQRPRRLEPSVSTPFEPTLDPSSHGFPSILRVLSQKGRAP
ncbi:MAG: hypothetical protein Q9212_003292 [Teloschistes hypoglaucus]